MTEEQKSIDKMTVKELREVAKELEMTGTSAMKKDELLAGIKEAKGVVVEKPADKAPKTAAKAPKTAKKTSSGKRAPLTSAKECKSLISSLRKEKEATKAEGDKVATAILRRRINVIKKKSRKFQKAL